MGKNSDETIRIIDSSLNENTVRLSDMSDTVRIDNTQRVEQSTVISSGLGGGIKLNTVTPNEYQLNGTKYTLLEKISESTAEAQIFLIANGKNKYVLKYYYPFVKPKMEVIEKLRTFSHPDIVQVIDSGYFEERFFEITAYADQGSLLKHIPINDVKLIKRFVKEIVNALEHCHKNGIIHRDIKPANIFVKDKKKKDIIVGDFGIASIVGSDEDLRRTSIFQTPIYAAPEYRMTLGGQTIISKAVDYYALGITVWEMWSGKLPPDGIDDLEFLRLMFEGTPPLPAGMDDEIAYLIKGLTTRDYKKRWGYTEVQKWLKGEPDEIYIEEVYSSSKTFDFGEVKGKKIKVDSPKELAKLLHTYPDLGRKHLYRGTIKDWLKKIGDQRLYIEIADITEYRFKDDEITGTKYAAYVIDRELPFIGVSSTACSTKDQLAEELKRNFAEYKSVLKNQNHSLYLYLLSKNMEKEVEQFRDYFQTLDGESALHYLIH
ncbi:MAG: protein kinase, partial [bacterium]